MKAYYQPGTPPPSAGDGPGFLSLLLQLIGEPTMTAPPITSI
jgi:hypothetical protein